MCYLSLNPHVSYCQGMTDLALPLLAVLPNLSLAFWCYVRLMDHSLLVGPDTAAAMKKDTVRGCLSICGRGGGRIIIRFLASQCSL